MSTYDTGLLVALGRAAEHGFFDRVADCPDCGEPSVWFQDDLPIRSVQIHLRTGKEAC